MAIKFGKAFGARVALFTHSKHKVDDAVALGADEVVLSSNESAMKEKHGTLDFILDTISANHDLTTYVNPLKRDGVMTVVDIPENPQALALGSLISPRKILAGSLIGGIKETQEMLDFCAENNVLCDIETIKLEGINEAYDRMLKSDVKYRFFIDMKKSF